jgi:hypothetical protein
MPRGGEKMGSENIFTRDPWYVTAAPAFHLYDPCDLSRDLNALSDFGIRFACTSLQKNR